MTVAVPAGAVDAPAGDGGTVIAAATPYPWPYDAALHSDRLVFLVAGAQRWWVDQTTGSAEALEAMVTIAALVRRVGGVVVATVHIGAGTSPWRRPSLPGRGAESAALALPLATADHVLECSGLDGFSGGPLAAYLTASRRDQLLVAGLSLEGPVHSTMRSANDRGLECLLVSDACSYDEELTRRAAISSVEMSGGIFGAVATTADVLAALTDLSDKETP